MITEQQDTQDTQDQDTQQKGQGQQEGQGQPEGQQDVQQPQGRQEDQGAQDGHDETTPSDDGGKAGADAARYRRRLRDVESERDDLAARMTALRKQVAEDASGLTRPSALWAAGTDADALFTDDGTLNRDALTQAVNAASEQLGLTHAPRTPKPDPSQGGVQDVSAGADPWADAFTPQ